MLDVAVVIAALATLVIATLTLLNAGAQDRMARAYARQFAVAQEEACPTMVGKAFWFSCASEVRRSHSTQP
jgi:hypothetical protein